MVFVPQFIDSIQVRRYDEPRTAFLVDPILSLLLNFGHEFDRIVV